MNKTKLKNYAPKARQTFLRIVRERADLLGLTKAEIDTPRVEGDVAIIEGNPYPKRFANLHQNLKKAIEAEGLESFIERVAYSWFNRFAAIRFMEVNGFLSHSYRVLSNRDVTKNEPEILEHAADVELAGLDKDEIVGLKLAGNKDAELYKLLLIAQCNELHSAMPFLFERINDETELLLPDNLLHTDSVIRKMTSEIEEEDWHNVEIIGWLYQFYISEKKDEVIGKTVKSADIPAATQLFTPNWIVKYMTQNSLGRLWLEANPTSQLAQNMEFFIEGVRGQGLGVREEEEREEKETAQTETAQTEGGKKDGDSEFSGFDRVAEGDGFGADGLSSDEGVSEGGTLRSDESGSAGGGFDSVEYSGRTRTEINEGVSQLSLDSEGIAGGSSNSANDRPTSELSDKSRTKSGSIITEGNRENAQQLDEQTEELGDRGQGLVQDDQTSSQTIPYPLTPNPSITNPEEIRILDPACGSGHILVEAYELMKAIYTERGYSSREIPLLILENNLFGLDIDKRAVQLASFALLMKARFDDRRIFEKLGTRGKGLGVRGQGLGEDDSTSSLTPNPLSLTPQIFIIPDSSELEYEPNGIAEMFFSDKANRGAVPIRDDKYMFADMNPQQSLMVGDSADQPLTPDPQPLNEVSETNIVDLLELFENGKTYGSLIRIPHGFGVVVEGIARRVQTKAVDGDMNEQIAARQLIPFVQAAQILALKYDAVIANPPYMGGKGMNAALKDFAKREFPESKSDLFAMFIERNLEMTKETGKLGFMTPFVWMFISSYEKLRDILINDATITTLVQLEYSGFAEATVPICTFTLAKKHDKNAVGSFVRLSDFRGHQNQAPKTLEAIQNPDCSWFYNAKPDDFKKIPGNPIAYWVSDKVREVFEKGTPLGEIGEARQGLITSNNDRFLRQWNEVNYRKLGLGFENKTDAENSNLKWYPYNKGGDFRKWYGNRDFVVNWKNDGYEIKNFSDDNGNIRSRPQSLDYYFRKGITWTDISSSSFGVRLHDKGSLFDATGSCLFINQIESILGYLITPICFNFLRLLNPTMHFQVGNIKSLPILEKEVNQIKPQVDEIVEEAVSIARADWDSFETSWDFERFPILDFGFWIERNGKAPNSVEEAFHLWEELTEDRIGRMQELETENNRLFITAYGLEDELEPEVPLEQITLARADRTDDTKKLLSYFIGCAMGRYSLDTSGLVYADAGGVGFDHSKYQTFTADEDGIIPVTDMEWFPQEAASRFADFIRVAFGEDKGIGVRDQGLVREEEEESNDNGKDDANSKSSPSSSLTPNPYSLTPNNLEWIANQIGKKANETPVEAIRRYFSKDFFKDHIKTYKKRPIYWLFSSGREKAFEALVYLHRYNEQTLARMRQEYVLPLMSKLEAQIENLAGNADEYGTRSGGLIDSAESTSDKSKLSKQLETYRKKQVELKQFDEQLRHFSDMKITLDLDDGVKENYTKFGDLVAMSKQISPKK